MIRADLAANVVRIGEAIGLLTVLWALVVGALWALQTRRLR